ncbi:MAG: flagellar basal body P-ring formation chaperone FlgA [Pseudomonadota bacterium]
MRWLALFAALVPPLPALADSVIAARTIRAKAVVAAADLAISPDDMPGAIRKLDEAVGREARATIFAGRPLTAGDLTEPAVVERNGLVQMVYDHGGLTILTDGRALNRGAPGERIRVMNLASRMTVTGTVAGPGRVTVP